MNFQRRQLHYYYFAATAKYNDDHFSALTEDGVVPKQQLFGHASDPWEGDIDERLQLEEEQRDADDHMEKYRNVLGMTSDGWVPTERYSEAKRMSEKFKTDAILLVESEEDAAQIQRHWLFDDFDEDE
ncbi:hypothetical protein CNMCM5793_001510 [Aspergillus hiratsukae]|uniref:Uncharacterized protein n=1 Tax=Aspergillus hiratsukae TaxID=1194566 RepID=A0A8H6UG01_9EURO|nr:hypothetical protein CNMCM5793_001510 [Aspergillus hiratsukae]